MIRPLMRKEVREHAAAYAALLLLSISAFVILGRWAGTQDSGSMLEPFGWFLFCGVPLSAALIAFGLVSKEHAEQTQLFLDALPTSRAGIAAVKLGVGLAILLIIFTSALGLALIAARAHEVLSTRFLGILAARTYCFIVFFYAFFFVVSFLGRYRLPAILGCSILMIAIDNLTKLEVFRVGPFSLVLERFAFEREVMPAEALLWTLGLSAGLFLLAFVLALTGEGSISALLARRMSHGEKVFVAVLLVGTVMAFAIIEIKQPQEPFKLHDVVVGTGKGVTVNFAPGPGGDIEAASRLAKDLHGQLVELKDYLGVQGLPTVFLTNRRDLDPDRYELGWLDQTEGEALLARIHFPAEVWDGDAFIAWIVRELLVVHSRGRVELEARRWILDGFGLYWNRRATAGLPLSTEPDLALRALYGTEGGLSRKDLDDWLTFREQMGEGIAAGLAFSGLRVLAESRGADRAQAFLRSVLAADVPHDARAMLHRITHPLGYLFQDEAGIGYDAFIEQWSEALEAERRDRETELALLPRLNGTVQYETVTSATRRISYSLCVIPEVPPGGRCRFLHVDPGPFDREIEPEDVRFEEHDCRALADGAMLPGTLGRGSRLAWTFALDVASLGCEVITGWVRQEVP